MVETAPSRAEQQSEAASPTTDRKPSEKSEVADAIPEPCGEYVGSVALEDLPEIEPDEFTIVDAFEHKSENKFLVVGANESNEYLLARYKEYEDWEGQRKRRQTHAFAAPGRSEIEYREYESAVLTNPMQVREILVELMEIGGIEHYTNSKYFDLSL